MVRHEVRHDCEVALRRTPAGGEIGGVVKAVPTGDAQLFQAPEIVDRADRIDRERQCARIG